MGQGVYTSLSQLLADELDVPFKPGEVAAAPPIEPTYSNPDAHIMVTVDQPQFVAFTPCFRKVGASGRAMLIQAAAGEFESRTGKFTLLKMAK